MSLCITMLLSCVPAFADQEVPTKGIVCSGTLDTLVDKVCTTKDLVEAILAQGCSGGGGDTENCASTPITAQQVTSAGGTLSLTEEGTYCLTESVTGSFVIDADNVTLDLNRFSINGIVSSTVTLRRNIVIKNGSMNETTTQERSAIVLSDFLNATVVDVAITGYSGGVVFARMTNVLIENVTIQYNHIASPSFFAGIYIQDSNKNVRIVNSVVTTTEPQTIPSNISSNPACRIAFNNNLIAIDHCIFQGPIGITFTGNNRQANALITDCEFKNCYYGVFIPSTKSPGTNVVENVIFSDCKATNIGSKGFFIGNGCFQFKFNRCCVLGIGDPQGGPPASGPTTILGFECEQPREVTFTDCIAQYCQKGFSLVTRINLSASEGVTLCNCITNACVNGFEFFTLLGITTMFRSIQLRNCKANAFNGTGVGFLFAGFLIDVQVCECGANNFNVGFKNEASNLEQVCFANCLTSHCATGFVGVTEPVRSPENARGPHNVDCTFSETDHVEETWSKVCLLECRFNLFINQWNAVNQTASIIDTCAV